MKNVSVREEEYKGPWMVGYHANSNGEIIFSSYWDDGSTANTSVSMVAGCLTEREAHALAARKNEEEAKASESLRSW